MHCPRARNGHGAHSLKSVHGDIAQVLSKHSEHADAKCYPHMHPYGTGSVLSEPHSGSPKGHFRNRACQIQSLFRRCAMWAFWKLDWLIKHELFNLHYRKSQQHGAAASSQEQEPDPYKRKYGTAIPKNIPERFLLFSCLIMHSEASFILSYPPTPLSPKLRQLALPSTCFSLTLEHKPTKLIT